MNDYVKNELWKLEVNNHILIDYVAQYVDNELTRCLLLQNLNLQGMIINNLQVEVLKNE
ncbi:hypothetical protein phiCPV4_0027 [Clostridium phage phiCPV4]|uniref:Uncharacterized protein n=1 Tax=Clostridium phage phiCPV4 TaxID=1162305 RepID=I3PV57_9CAUD|nr:hypothetical protein PHICPV4_gp27 [Clostridium phage phiCPV4]AFH27133.1 hypothetical protein phiCPV4_0027 [Clostridium phage phiCPV4]